MRKLLIALLFVAPSLAADRPAPNPQLKPFPSLSDQLKTNSETPANTFHEIAGCKESDYVSLDQPAVTIEIAGLMYNPKCLKIKPGTSVTIQALVRHQLNAMAPFDGIANPFKQDKPATTSQMRVLTTSGQYGFWCYPHGDENGEGMAAAIWVAP